MGVSSSAMNDSHIRQSKWHKRTICLTFVGLAALLLVLASAPLLSGPSPLVRLRVLAYGTMTRNDEQKWAAMSTRAAQWESSRVGHDEEDDRNWSGLRKMHQQRADGSLWWDERAEEYFISQLEKSQFPTDCSKAHWIAKHEMTSGLLSATHIFELPLFFSMVRGHTLVPISEPKRQPAFEGCGPNLADRNIRCFFNVTNCSPAADPARLSKVLAMNRNLNRTSWEELLMEDDDFFSPGGITVIQTWKLQPWATEVCVSSSSFSSFFEAYTYHKFSLWDAMGRHGKVGVLKSSADRATKALPADQTARSLRVDMAISSILSSWMLNRVRDHVKLVADQVMSRYVDSSGQPLWKSPVLAIHIRQTDKSFEDPYYNEHGAYRPIEDYALVMKRMEEEYLFQWPSIFLISDSGTAMESLMTVINGNESTTSQLGTKRFIMYDWIVDDHLIEKFHDHNQVPKDLKNDMQTHFLATLYIVQKIADNAIVTYSSNVGRFIGEIIAAKHRQVYADRQGPLVTSVDRAWFWN